VDVDSVTTAVPAELALQLVMLIEEGVARGIEFRQMRADRKPAAASRSIHERFAARVNSISVSTLHDFHGRAQHYVKV
jgi:hypothetical protein